MPAEKTHADSMRWYNTGASSHGSAQTNQDGSIGGHLSSTEVKPITHAVLTTDFTSDHTYLQFSAENGAGVATIDVVGSVNMLAYTAPGGSQGAPVLAALGGGYVLLEDGADPNKWVVVKQVGGVDAEVGAQETYTLTVTTDTMFGFDKVTSAEQSAGDDNYRTHGFECHNADGMSAVTVQLKTLGTQQTTDGGQLGASGSGTITTTGSFASWPQSGWAMIKNSGGTVQEDIYYSSRSSTVLTVDASGRNLFGLGSESAGSADDTIDAVPGIVIDVEEPSQPSGAVALGADEDTAPAGATYTMPITDAEAIAVSDLSDTHWVAIHAKRRIPAGATASTGNQCPYVVDFDAG